MPNLGLHDDVSSKIRESLKTTESENVLKKSLTDKLDDVMKAVKNDLKSRSQMKQTFIT